MIKEIPVENKIEDHEDSSFIGTNNIQSFKQRPLTIRFNNLNKIKQEQTIQGGEFALHQIYQLKKLSTQMKKMQTDKNLSIISIHSYDIKSYREKKKINANDTHIMTNEEAKNLRNALSNHFVFREITPEVLDSVINECIFCTFLKGNIIYNEGEEGNFFYVISKGKIQAYDKLKKVIKKYGEWDCFGELSLITQQKREETVKCLENVELFSIDGISFRETQKRINEQILKERYDFLNNIFIFETLDTISKYNVAQRVILKTFEKDTKIINFGEIGYDLYIIKEGLVSCRIDNKEIRQLKVNDYFGQNAILIDTKRGMDVIAIEKTSCFQISKDALIEALGENYTHSILFCFFKNCIEKSESLKVLFHDNLINEIYKLFNIGIYSKDEKLLNENSAQLYKKNPSWSFGKKNKLDKNEENQYIKTRNEKLEEKIKNIINKQKGDNKYLFCDVSNSYNLVNNRGKLPIIFRKKFKYEETEQYKASRDKYNYDTPAPNSYWDDGKSIVKLRKNIDEQQAKKYIMNRDKTFKRLYVSKSVKSVF